MAKTRAPSESTSGRLKALFQENHELLRARDYDGLKQAWEKAYPGKPFNEGVRQIAANVKSRLRKEMGMRKRRRKTGVSANGAHAPAVPKPLKAALLQPLEEHIDECLMLARAAGKDQLMDVIRSLKRARNLLIVMIGEK